MKLLAWALCFAVAACAAYGKDYYLKMPDGDTLYTSVDGPWFSTPEPGDTGVIVFDRSPYGHFALEMFAMVFGMVFELIGDGKNNSASFALSMRQDMQGTQGSNGLFDVWHSAGINGKTTIEWAVNQSFSNGTVFSMGASADGLASLAMAVAPGGPPAALGAQFIIFASSSGYEVAFPGGADRLSLIQLWMESTLPNQAPALIEEVLEHEAPGVWWNALNLTGHFDNVVWPSTFWAGWYDIFLVGNLLAFEGYQYQGGPGARGRSRIVVDPLGHCQSAHTYFPNHTIEGRVALPILLALDMMLGFPAAELAKPVTFYVMGPALPDARGQYWTSLDAWPRFTTTPLYLAPNFNLSWAAPTSSAARLGSLHSTSASYLYNPASPVPSIGGNNLKIHCGPLDQRPTEAAVRGDVLTFTSGELSADMYLTGPINAVLYVSSNATDTDFMVRLTDVYPDGTSRLVQDGARRMRWRIPNSPEPAWMQPGQVYQADLSLWNTSYVFNQGHRIRVDISSSNYPRFGINRNNRCPQANTSCAANVTAYNTVLFSAQYPSRVELPVVQPAQLPPVDVLDLTARLEQAVLPAAAQASPEVQQVLRSAFLPSEMLMGGRGVGSQWAPEHHSEAQVA